MAFRPCSTKRETQSYVSQFLRVFVPSNSLQEAVNPGLYTGAWGPRKGGVGEGLAERVGKGLAKGWRRVGKGLAQGWGRVGKGLADFLAPSN